MGTLDRRELLAAGAAAALLARTAWADPPTVPIAVASANGLGAVAKACDEVAAGRLPVEGAVAGVSLNEADPQDTSVGYGGSPNEEGVMELDACCMDGTRGLGGAVAGIQNIMHPSQVALHVLERTDHVMLVGHGAYRFARAHGFKHQDILTDEARKRWLRWKENLSDKDDWVGERERGGGTIPCLVRAPAGAMGGCTTTSGLSYKIPGRVGDSPILGAGLYVDDTAGAAGATGRGEAVILTSGSALTVEAMRRGMGAQEAALETCKRIVARTRVRRLLDEQGRPRFDVKIYALRKDGDHGAASIWSGATYAVQDVDGVRKREAAFVFERPKKGAK